MADDDYKIGYGKPPLKTRFKKGASGNPSGRPRRSKDFSTLLERQLDRLITVTQNGRKVRVPMREQLVTSTLIAALKGESRARELVFRHMRENGKLDPFGANGSDEKIWAELAGTLTLSDGKNPLEEG